MFKRIDANRIRRSLARSAQWRLGLAALLVALLLLPAAYSAPASAQAAAPAAPKGPGSPDWVSAPDPWLYYGGGHAGSIFIGAEPPGGGSKPVLVYVVGMHGQAHDWWQDTAYYGHNNMYDYAYNWGYRTAFVSLWDANGAYWGKSMWDNGQLLASQLEMICNYFGVPYVNVVAHSKGGIDTQAAIAWYNAGPRVQKLLTLDTPHWGSQVADLAYSNNYWWVGALIGQLDDATWSLQTGYMNAFRSVTDGRWQNGYTQYYTTAGTDWGPGALWWGGLYLAQWGSNDGLVTVNNAHLPWWISTHVSTNSVNHDNVRMGSWSMGLANQYLSSFWRTWMGPEQAGKQFSAPATVPAGGDTANPTAHVASGSILRGGPLGAKGTTTTDQITVETGATGLAIDLMSNVAGLDLTWTAPDGQQYTARGELGAGDDFFSTAYHYGVKVDAPPAGTWRLSVRNTTDKPAAYAVMANVTSPVTVALDRDPALVFAAGGKLPFSLTATDAQGRTIRNLHVSGVLRHNAGAPQTLTVSAGRDMTQASVDLPTTAGVANMTFTVTGQLADGSAFERSIVTSVAVVDQAGQMPLPPSPKGAAPVQP